VKIRVDRGSLVAGLKTLKAAAAVRGRRGKLKPVLNSARLTVDRGGLTVAATDLETAAAFRVQADECDEPAGRVERLIDLALLERLARETAKTPTIAIEFPAGGGCRVDALATLPEPADAAEFPAVDELESRGGNWRTVATWLGLGGELETAINAVEFATDTNASRYALGAVLLEFRRDQPTIEQLATAATELAAIATDGRRISIARAVGGLNPPEFPGDRISAALRFAEPFAAFLLPAKAAAAFAECAHSRRGDRVVLLEIIERQPAAEPAAAGNSEPVNQAAEPARVDRRLRLTVADRRGNVLAVLTSREIDGRFPNWRAVFRENQPATEPAAAGWLAADGSTVDALRSIVRIAAADCRCVRLAVRGGERGGGLAIYRNRSERVKLCGKFGARMNGSPRWFSVAVNPDLLLPWLIETQPLSAGFVGGWLFSQSRKDGAIAFSTGGGSREFLIMPLAVDRPRRRK
jgi:hypothetical protein